MNSVKLHLNIIASLLLLVLGGCATQYRFVSTPEGAAIYQRTPTQKVLLGETPMDFAKTGLPTDSPFVVVFEKQGYEPREVAITPTDNSLTTVTIQLKNKEPGGPDEGMKRMHGVIRQIFAIQELIFKKKYVDAMAALKTLETAEGKLPEVFVLRGSVYATMNDPVQARREWEKALALDPSMEELKVHLAQLSKDTPAPGVKQP